MKPEEPLGNTNDDPSEVDEIASVFLEDLHPECWAAEAELVSLVCPLSLFAAWFAKQPEPVRERIGGSVGDFVASDVFYRRLPAKLRCPVRRLEAWLECASPTPEQTLGRLAVVRQAIDLCVFRNRSTRDDWAALSNETVDQLVSATHCEDAEMSALCRHGLEALPARALLWIESARSWRQLCASVLSEEALSCWMEIAFWQQD